jgi:hypothetical protein
MPPTPLPSPQPSAIKPEDSPSEWIHSGEHVITGKLTLTDIRRFIFDRLNTGGTKLNPQEIRNALNPGVLNKVIIDLTRNPLFTKIFDIPKYSESDPSEYYEHPERQKNSLYSTMGDCQLVLRYFALIDPRNIRGSMKSMLDRAMEMDINAERGEELKTEYLERLSFLDRIFEGLPFRLPADHKGRIRISAAIYDASMIAANKLWEHHQAIARDAEGVRYRMNAALTDTERLNLLTGAGNTANAVRDRIALMRALLRPE